MKKTEEGFTLIELMMVVLIISVLVIIALPAYQSYTIRTQVSEGILATAGLRQAAAEYHLSNKVFPVNNAEIGITTPTNFATQWVKEINVQSADLGVTTDVLVTMSIPGVDGKVLKLHVYFNNNAYQFTCGRGGTNALADQYLPGSCREDIP